MAGVIYQITCIPTGLLYVGQAKDYKTKNGTPYHYGATGRWNDHVSTAKTRDTPLCRAIKEHGRNNFIITVLEEAPLEDLDEREATWLARVKCIYPHGYNVATHSRNRHRDESNLHVFYQGRVSSVEICPIRREGKLRLIHVYVTLEDGKRERLAFGQKKESTYEEAMEEATTFLERLGCEYSVSKDYSDVLSERYQKTLDEFNDKTITSVRITTASHLIAVYIGTSDMKLKKEHIRICFGGKTIDKKNAYTTAIQFINQLDIIDDNIIQDSIRSQQQATAT